MSRPIVVDLPESLTIAVAESLHEQLEQLLPEGQDIILNGAPVSRTDTAGLQTLLGFSQTLASRNTSLSWLSPSSVLVDAAQQLGLQTLLRLP